MIQEKMVLHSEDRSFGAAKQLAERPLFSDKGLCRFPLSAKMFFSLILCVAGLGYLALLGGIWLDTEMKLVNIIEAYSSMEAIELVQHSFHYLFWFFGIFTVTLSLFLMSSFSEVVKRFFGVGIPILIVSDVSSAWLVKYSDLFAGVMACSGFLLAASFLLLFLFIQRDLWLKKLS